MAYKQLSKEENDQILKLIEKENFSGAGLISNPGDFIYTAYKFTIEKPKNEDEKSYYVIIWIIDLEKSPGMARAPFIEESGRGSITGFDSETAKQLQVPFYSYSITGNYKAIVKQFNLPQKNPKNGNPVTYSDVTVHLELWSYLKAKKEDTEYMGNNPNPLEQYLEYSVLTTMNVYRRSAYQIVGSTEADIKKNLELPENQVNLIQIETVQNNPPPPTNSTTGATVSGSASNADIAEVPKSIPPGDLKGKLLIKKKSGPGEITGEFVESTLSYSFEYGLPVALFKEIQFTAPGDYEITISSDNPSIEPKDVKIKVLSEDQVVAQEEKNTETKPEKQIEGDRPIIAQIDKPTIVVPPITFDKDKTTTNDGNRQFTDGLGYTPLLYYKGISYEERNIKRLRLFHEGIVPKIDCSFFDSQGVQKDVATPENNTTMDFFLNSTSKNLKSIHFKFKIEKFSKGPEKSQQDYFASGTIDVPDLYVIQNKTYTGTSFEVLRQICSELGLGFNSNIKNTNDSMVWKNNNKKPFEFMQEIIAHSYISDDSFMAGYIDYYYCFNYVDVEKENKRNIENDVMVETSQSSGLSTKDELKRIVPLYLTNEKSQESASTYFGNYKFKNNSTEKSLNEGNLTITRSYDPESKQFEEFTVDSTTSDGEKTIILKGERSDENNWQKNIKTFFAGKIHRDNVHGNYTYAMTQNRINLDKLCNIEMELELPNSNYNLYKFQKVRVSVFNQNQTPTAPSIMVHRYSGDYIILDIEYNWSRSKMSQKLKVVKKELNKTPEEVKNDPPMQKAPETKERNENPIVGTSSVPNSVYQVGETYVVQDKEGKKYSILIKKILENGIEVLGDLTLLPSTNSQTPTIATTGPVTQPGQPIRVKTKLGRTFYIEQVEGNYIAYNFGGQEKTKGVVNLNSDLLFKELLDILFAKDSLKDEIVEVLQRQGETAIPDKIPVTAQDLGSSGTSGVSGSSGTSGTSNNAGINRELEADCLISYVGLQDSPKTNGTFNAENKWNLSGEKNTIYISLSTSNKSSDNSKTPDAYPEKYHIFKCVFSGKDFYPNDGTDQEEKLYENFGEFSNIGITPQYFDSVTNQWTGFSYAAQGSSPDTYINKKSNHFRLQALSRLIVGDQLEFDTQAYGIRIWCFDSTNNIFNSPVRLIVKYNKGNLSVLGKFKKAEAFSVSISSSRTDGVVDGKK